MEQQQQSRGRPTLSQVVWTAGIIVALALLLSFFGGYYFGWKWTGLVKDANFPMRTLWDWMKLLIIPAVLAGGVSGSTANNESKRYGALHSNESKS